MHREARGLSKLTVVLVLLICGVTSLLIWFIFFYSGSYIAVQHTDSEESKQVTTWQTRKLVTFHADSPDGLMPKDLSTIAVSPDGQHIAYVLDDREGAFVVVDGKRGKLYAQIIGAPVFSPDSKSVAYVAVSQDKSNKGVLLVVNEREGKAFGAVWHPIFSSDSKRIGYLASEVIVTDKNKDWHLWWIVEDV
jgi:Tol biopolymer transport system component